MWWWLVACVSDPELDAWHKAIEVESASLALGDCVGELVEVDPVEDFLFVAVNRGFPDLITLYWCPEAEDCGAPAASAYVTELTETRAVGNLAEPIVNIGVCTILWFDLEATRTGAAVDLHYRVGRLDLLDLSPDACEAAGPDAIGSSCDEVWSIQGTQVDD